MSFNFLLDEYPNEVIVEEVVYKVNTDFKCILSIIQLLDNDLFCEQEKIINSIRIFYGNNIPRNTSLAFNELIGFIQLYQEEKTNSKKHNKVIDYTIDSGLILSAFMQVYKINLIETNLHWFAFSCLLENISDEQIRLIQIMNIRSMEIDENYSAKQKQRIRKLKKEYSLEKQEDISNDFANSFFLGVKGGQNK
ncbi:Gp15 family bacteriophage protein [Anaerorhabdus furcosa]|uniref:Bacteriophage Gp15 protein n=1 Tax=Anaerorhabdus furcosa TaxID=118967 RepID=A0A1T4LQS0_9FIRM|nr:Gp15 family bacteriophage protein [Anaerorhabdus furcosa]SJZ56987.1 Bacteriophage Gp15 protein [Anaerorhabdus furcosa]